MISSVANAEEIREVKFSGVNFHFTSQELNDPKPMTKAELCDLLLEASKKDGSTIEVVEETSRFRR